MSLPCKQPMVAWWHFLCPSFLAFWLVTLRTPLPSSWLFFGDCPLFWWFFCHAHAGDHMPATLHALVTWWTLIGRCPAFNYSSCTSSLFSFSCSTFNHACCYLWPMILWAACPILDSAKCPGNWSWFAHHIRNAILAHWSDSMQTSSNPMWAASKTGLRPCSNPKVYRFAVTSPWLSRTGFSFSGLALLARAFAATFATFCNLTDLR